MEENSYGCLRDITDGECYRRLLQEGGFLHDSDNLSATFNTDGVNLFSSSKVELWPIFLALNELSPAQRFSRENMLLVGIWQGKGKPPFQPYMEIFAEEMNKLKEEGVQISTHGRNTCCKLLLTCCIADLPAKASLLNMTYFNGCEACIACEEPGLVVKQGKGHSRSYPFRDVPHSLRKDEAVRRNMEEATDRKRVKGFRGKSGLLALKSYDLVRGTVPDYMHCVLLGITKNLLQKWFSPTESGKDYFIGKHLKGISCCLQKIKPPHYIERLPRDIEKHYANYKATELQAWLLFYCIPCVQGILPAKYLDHFSLLSEGIYILLGDSITPQALIRAESLLKKFYQSYSKLYGAGSCGLNVHNAGLHLVQYVRHWGPLWAWSTFPFEDCNAMLLDSVHGTGNVTQQVMKTRHAEASLREMNTKVSEEVPKVTSRSGVNIAENCVLHGAHKAVPEGSISPRLMHKIGVDNCKNLVQVKRIEIEGDKFYSSGYSRMQRRTCNCVLFQNKKCGLVQKFVCEPETKHVYAIVDILERQGQSKCAEGKHLIPVAASNTVDIIPVEEIMETLIYICTDHTGRGNALIARAPNKIGRCIFK